ncbi:hypothetical protein B0H13DRAFT_2033048 [Mycena leptocephala]|nr:hypothetical protein B0H13DRAFT_2033048 [Mycena leptocephala]
MHSQAYSTAQWTMTWTARKSTIEEGDADRDLALWRSCERERTFLSAQSSFPFCKLHILDREERYRRKWSAALSQFHTTPPFSSRLVPGEPERRPLSFANGFHPSLCHSLRLCGSCTWHGLALSTALHLARSGSFSVASFPYWCCQLSRRTRCQWASSGTPTLTHPTDLRRVARDTLALSAPSSACTSTSAAAAETRHRALRRWLLALRPQEEDIRRSITTLTPSTTRASIRSGPQPLGKAPHFHVALAGVRRSPYVDGRNVAINPINSFVRPPKTSRITTRCLPRFCLG